MRPARNLRFNHRVRSAAADWSVYPVGTVFKVKGLPYIYVVDDYGSALVGTQTVDMFMPDPSWMKAWGSRKVELSVVRWGSFERSAELLRKRTRYSHCRSMYAAILAAPESCDGQPLRRPSTGSAMTKAERARHVQQRLDELYPQPPIPLDHCDPFTLLVAVLLSAQCTDARVNKVTPALFALAGNPREMARQSVEAVDPSSAPAASRRARRRRSSACRKSWLMNMAARCRRTWRRSRRCRGWATRPPRW